ncbi:hypothetical protein K8R66_03495 [bacterium]|nr:hypothetical protein [bacterium]
MKKILIVLVFCLILSSLFSSDVIKIKQKIGSSYNFYLVHSEKNWATQLVYASGNKPCLLFGVAPLYSFNVDKSKVKLISYFNLKLNVNEKHWPLTEFQNDTFVIISIEKWLLYLRVMTKIDRNENLSWWGREFLEYQVFEDYKLRLQTEWSYKDQEWMQFLGPAMEYKIAKQLSLTIYLGINTSYPYEKSGWIEIKKKFK